MPPSIETGTGVHVAKQYVNCSAGVSRDMSRLETVLRHGFDVVCLVSSRFLDLMSIVSCLVLFLGLCLVSCLGPAVLCLVLCLDLGVLFSALVN
jgi:hypothetical protein